MRTAPLVLLTCLTAGALSATDVAARPRPRHAHASAHTAVQPSAPEIVRTDAGQVQGLVVDGVVAFKGLPYAEPPVGDLRWRAPRPPKPWSDVLAADRVGPDCIQTRDAPQSEDCLTLNVWRPVAQSDHPRPVLVWIHGGGLVDGSSADAPGDLLAAQGMVVVSMNYRLGRLGFFAHPALATESPEEAHGDYGYLDQLAALAWVQRNIAAFGGDPKLVTIVGRVDDGSVMTHLTSPMSRGLFQRAVLVASGRPVAQAKAPSPLDLAEAQRRGVEYALSRGMVGDGMDTLRRLRALPAAEFAEGVSEQAVLKAAARGGYVIGVAGAIRDGRLIVEAPEAAISARRQAMTPLLVVADQPDYGLQALNSKDALFALFGRQVDAAVQLYDPKGDRPLDAIKQQVAADAAVGEPARRLADATAGSGQPTWFYRFSYVVEPPRKHHKAVEPASPPVAYVFSLPAARNDSGSTGGARPVDALAGAYLVSFAATGDPNGAGQPTWPRYQPSAADDGKARPDLWRAAAEMAGAPVEAAAAGDPTGLR